MTLHHVWAEADDGDDAAVRKPLNGPPQQGLCDAAPAVLGSHGQPGHPSLARIGRQQQTTSNRAGLVANNQGVAALDVLEQDPTEVRHRTEQRLNLGHVQEPRVNVGRDRLDHAHDRHPTGN
jgi:hypothetical protein